MYSLTDKKAAIGIHNTDNISYSGGASMPNTASVGTVWFGHTGIQGYAPDSSYGTFTTGDIIGAKLDMDSKTIQYTKNGVAQGTVNFSSAGFDNVIACGLGGSNTQTTIANFGSDSSFAGTKTPQGNQDANGIGDFYYAPPTGFLALCTANLPDVDVIPSENFNTVLYSGNGSSGHAITGVGFQPDFTWIKGRDVAYDHKLWDAVRGSGIRLETNTTAAEVTSAGLTSFDSDGFTVENNPVNNGSYVYVAWNWKAGGSASSNTNGSITSSVSANPSAGFSIVSYSGSGVVSTVGHGLASAPEMLIVKERTSVDNWFVYHASNTSAPETENLRLNLTNATADSLTYWNDTLPSSSVFTLGTTSGVNGSSDTYIAYAFHSVDSYSKVGSFIGNGNADGPFVNCGFKPKFVMLKRSSEVGAWFMFDTERSTYNVMDDKLEANSSGAEDADSSWNIDFLSNGFKLRSPHIYMNSSGNTHIFLAFAESPFKHSNAR